MNVFSGKGSAKRHCSCSTQAVEPQAHPGVWTYRREGFLQPVIRHGQRRWRLVLAWSSSRSGWLFIAKLQAASFGCKISRIYMHNVLRKPFWMCSKASSLKHFGTNSTFLCQLRIWRFYDNRGNIINHICNHVLLSTPVNLADLDLCIRLFNSRFSCCADLHYYYYYLTCAGIRRPVCDCSFENRFCFHHPILYYFREQICLDWWMHCACVVHFTVGARD